MFQNQWSHPFALVLLAALLSTAWGCQSENSPKEDKPAAEKAQGDKAEGDKAQKGEGDKGEDGAAKATEGGGETLTVYCGRKDKLVKPVLDAFEKDTGIKLRVKYGGTQDLAATLLKEGDKSPADVFFSQDASTLGYLADKEIFAELPHEATKAVKIDYRDARSRWVGTSGRARVLVYNIERVKPDELPKAVEDLADPKWKGRVGWAPENASFKSFVATMIQLKGADATRTWLEQVHKNEAKAYPKNTPAVRATATGDVDVALVNHYYLFRVKEELGDSAPIANYYFRNGQAESLVNMAGVGLVKTSKKRQQALKLIQYLLAKKSQEHFAHKVYEFPVTGEVKADEKLPSIDSLKLPVLDMGQVHNLGMTEVLLKKSGVLP